MQHVSVWPQHRMVSHLCWRQLDKYRLLTRQQASSKVSSPKFVRDIAVAVLVHVAGLVLAAGHGSKPDV